MTLLLDISRTVARARLPAPTGIDRVERAYIVWALPRDARFLCHIDGVQHVLTGETVVRLLAWLDGDGPDPALDRAALLRPTRDLRLRRAQSLIRREAVAQLSGPGDLANISAYLNVGHDNLSDVLMAHMRGAGVATAVLLHDVIPLDHPDLTREGTPEKFRAKLKVALGADALIVNSAHTAERVAAHAGAEVPSVTVAPLGISPVTTPQATPGNHFVCLGTIEPRKNHAVLLDLWARLAAEMDAAPPVLHVVGRRGWRNAEVFARLNAGPAHVREHEGLSDADLAVLLTSARALLFPSLAEGYGLPLAEALQLGCPVIASDLPALRSVGGDVPEYLDPKNPHAWEQAIRDYATDPSPRRDAQLSRLATWSAPLWADHFTAVEKLLETILVQVRGRG